MEKGKENSKREKKVYLNPADAGRSGRNFETEARFLLNKKTACMGSMGQGKADIILYDKNTNKRIVIEAKTGCGKVLDTLDGIDITLPAEAHSEHFFRNADYVLYAPEYSGDADTLQDEAWMFTRDEFINFLNGYNKPMVKYNGNAINIQSFNSKKKEEYLWNNLYEQPTLAEWIEANR